MDQSLGVPLTGGTLAAGATQQVTVPFTVPLAQMPGPGLARARATWQDAGANAYGPSSAAMTTTISAHPTLQMTMDGPRAATAGDTVTYNLAVTNTATGTNATANSLSIALLLPGGEIETVDGGSPLAPGASRVIPIQATLPATLTSGAALSAIHLTWQDSGQNVYGPLTGVVTTTITALATATPTDTATATSTPSPTASPTPGIVSAAIERVTGSFFANPSNSGAFVTSPSTPPVFSEQFPVIDFNPPGGASTFCRNSTGINENARPFADVVPQPDGTCAAQVAQSVDGSQQAGVGNLGAFQAVFTSTLDVSGAGYATFNFFSDDGWVFAIGPSANGDQPSYYGGAFANPPPAGPFTGYKVVGSYNGPSAPTANNVTVYFPRGGRYPVELDYTECCGGPLSFTVDLNAQSIPSAPTDTPTPLPTDTPTVGPSNTPVPSATPQSALETPGWIGSPANGATVSGQVPIQLASGETLQSGTVDYWPADNPNALTTLVSNVQGSGTVATLDTTTLDDGSYVLRVQGTDTTGASLTSEVYVSVVGENKPGRVRFTVTDLSIPVGGLPISINRTYDSLERAVSGDFGYGWSLGFASAHVQVDPASNVTLTLPNGRRSTFYFTPQGHILYETPAYTGGPGVYGNLTADGCQLLEPAGNGYACLFGDGPNGMYQPSTYTYTDPYGRVYTCDASGQLLSERDLSGDTLTISRDGIVSSNGDLVVPFVRDGSGRITAITDPDGTVYRYSYDEAGNLVGVDLPGVTAPSGQAHSVTYSYDSDHLFTGAVDARGNQLVTSTYFPDRRLQTVTDAAGNTTRYAYDVLSNTTTITNPDGGVDTRQTDDYGMLVREVDPLGRISAYHYDANHNLTSKTDAAGTTSYTYDAQGNQTSMTLPGNRTTTTAYNQYAEPTTKIDAQGNTQTITYDPSTFLPTSVADSLDT